LLTHCKTTEGAKLPQRAFSSEKIGRFVQEGFVESGLAQCTDWGSWKPTNCDFRNAKARAFIPSYELLWADIGSEVVSTFGDYCRERYEQRAPLHSATRLVIACRDSGVSIPKNVLKALESGTGLFCDFGELRNLLLGLPEDKRSQKLCAALASVGRTKVDELRPIWEQHEWGRVYCSKPAAINMPKEFLPSLRSVNGLPLRCVDFSSFELRLACKIAGQHLPDGDAYQRIAEGCGIDRARVKQVVNPMLHGQTRRHLWYGENPCPHAKADRPLVEEEMGRQFPKLIAAVKDFTRDPALLQRSGARVFFPCMSAAMDGCEITSAGLPKHDGWVCSSRRSRTKSNTER
jgi:hypothetical protein